MSTTHSTSEPSGLGLTSGSDYTVVATGRSSTLESPICLLVLHRGGRIDREGLFRELSARHNGEIISLESTEHSYDVERLAQRHAKVRFILPSIAMSIGAQINIGIQESQSPYVYVIWNDMRMAEISERAQARVLSEAVLCTAPYIRNDRSQVIPTLMTPALEARGNLRVLPQAPYSEQAATLFPYDYVGVYSRRRFLDVLGYDSAIAQAYWQKLEFGLRSWMWGESIRLSSALRVSYSASAPTEDTTPNEDYLRFYWKTLGVKLDGTQTDLSMRRLLGGLWRSPASAPSLLKSFRTLRQELGRYPTRYKKSALRLISEWETEGW